MPVVDRVVKNELPLPHGEVTQLGRPEEFAMIGDDVFD
jgi:hypothetical protein